MNLRVGKKGMAWRRVAPVLVAAGLLLAAAVWWQSSLRGAFAWATAPVSRSLWLAGVGTSSWLHGSLGSYASVAQQNQQLNAENEQLLAQVAQLQDVLRQNALANQATQSTSGIHAQLMAARVLGADETHDTITIDKGSADGVAAGMPVVGSQSFVYGKISSVAPHNAQVELVTSASSIVDAKIQNSDPSAAPVYGALKGKGGGSSYLDMVPVGAQVSPGAVLVTSSLGGIFPPDLPLGKVVAVEKNPASPFQTASVSLFLDLRSTETVFLITNYNR